VKIGTYQQKLEKLKSEKQKRERRNLQAENLKNGSVKIGICQQKPKKQKLEFFCAEF